MREVYAGFRKCQRLQKIFVTATKTLNGFRRRISTLRMLSTKIAADLELSKFQYAAQNDITDVILEDASHSLQEFSLKPLISQTSYGQYKLALVTLVARFFDLNTAIRCLDEAQKINACQYSFFWEDIANGAELKESNSMTREAVVQIVGFNHLLCKNILNVYAGVIGPFDEDTDLEERTEMQYELLCWTLSDENKSLEFVDLWNTNEKVLLMLERFCKESGEHKGKLADFRYSFIAVDGKGLKSSLDVLLRKLSARGVLHHYSKHGNTFVLIPKNHLCLSISVEDVGLDHLSLCIESARGLYAEQIPRLQIVASEGFVYNFGAGSS
uniref:Separase n=1 Tax=Syphacia muris TaxID=451379 RepID=A0A0N5AXQ0_9BILA